MTDGQLSLLDPAPPSAVRRSDPRPSKAAAASNREGRETQASRILAYLRHHDYITADTAQRVLTLPGEDVTRGEWSARLGVLCSKKRGQLERAGEVEDVDRHGHRRMVLSYRLRGVA